MKIITKNELIKLGSTGDFFDGDQFRIEKIEKGNLLEYMESVKSDITNGVFCTLGVESFFFVTAAPGNAEDVGKLTIVFHDHDLSSEEVSGFNEMIHRTLPISIWLGCFIFNNCDSLTMITDGENEN